MKKRNLVVANWKMNPEKLEEAKKIFQSIKKYSAKLKKTDVVICPSFSHTFALSKLLPAKNLSLGAQNCHSKNSGAYTGEVSIAQLKDLKVKYVIVGHSEVREMGERDGEVNEKVKGILNQGLTPILCVGEKERDSEGSYLQFIKNQLAHSLADISKKDLLNLIIAYEPVWAIGKSSEKSLSSTDMHEMSIFIRKFLSDRFGKDYGWNVRILYGGSVEHGNAGVMMEKGEIAGLLVGHASLVSEEFKEILKETEGVK